MANEAPDSKLPSLISVGMIVVGLIIGAIGGLADGSIAGGVIAGLGAVPAGWGLWVGIQQKTQTTLGVALLLLIASLGVGGLLILLRVVAWLT